MIGIIKDPEVLKTIQILIILSPFFIPVIIIGLVLKKGYDILAKHPFFWIVTDLIFIALRYYLYRAGEISLNQLIYDVITFSVIVLLIVVKRKP